MASKYKKNKVKFKWTKELIILIVALVAIISVTIILSVPTAKQKTTSMFNEAIAAANTTSSNSSDSYDYLSDDNVYEEITHEKLVDVLSSGEEYVYVLYGSVNSTTILANLSYINSMAQDEEIKTVYFYSSLWVEETEDTDTATFKEQQRTIEDELNANKSADVDGFSLLEYPAIMVFHNGSLIFNSQQHTDISEYNWNMFIQKALFISRNNA